MTAPYNSSPGSFSLLLFLEYSFTYSTTSLCSKQMCFSSRKWHLSWRPAFTRVAPNVTPEAHALSNCCPFSTSAHPKKVWRSPHTHTHTPFSASHRCLSRDESCHLSSIGSFINLSLIKTERCTLRATLSNCISFPSFYLQWILPAFLQIWLFSLSSH